MASGASGSASQLKQGGAAAVGDRVALAIGPLGALDAIDDHTAIALEPGERRVHLAEGQRAVRREDTVELLLELVPVARLMVEEAEQRVLDAHAPTIH